MKALQAMRQRFGAEHMNGESDPVTEGSMYSLFTMYPDFCQGIPPAMPGYDQVPSERFRTRYVQHIASINAAGTIYHAEVTINPGISNTTQVALTLNAGSPYGVATQFTVHHPDRTALIARYSYLRCTGLAVRATSLQSAGGVQGMFVAGNRTNATLVGSDMQKLQHDPNCYSMNMLEDAGGRMVWRATYPNELDYWASATGSPAAPTNDIVMGSFSMVADCSFEVEIYHLWEGIPVPTSGTLTSARSVDVSEEAATEAQYLIRESGASAPDVVTGTNTALDGFLTNAKDILSKVKGLVPALLDEFIFTDENRKNSPFIGAAASIYDVATDIASLFGRSREEEVAIYRLLRCFEITTAEDVKLFDELAEQKLVPPQLAKIVRSIRDLRVRYLHRLGRKPGMVGVQLNGSLLGLQAGDSRTDGWEDVSGL
jgi:hypothetical protein